MGWILVLLIVRVVDNREQRCGIYTIDVLCEGLERWCNLLPVSVVLLHHVVGAIADGVENGHGPDRAVLWLVDLAVALGLDGLLPIECLSDLAWRLVELGIEVDELASDGGLLRDDDHLSFSSEVIFIEGNEGEYLIVPKRFVRERLLGNEVGRGVILVFDIEGVGVGVVTHLLDVEVCLGDDPGALLLRHAHVARLVIIGAVGADSGAVAEHRVVRGEAGVVDEALANEMLLEESLLGDGGIRRADVPDDFLIVHVLCFLT